MDAQIERTLERVATLLEEETAEIRAGKVALLPSFVIQKEMLAFELARLLSMLPQRPADASARARRAVIRGIIEDNLAALEAQLAAIKEIAALLLMIKDAADSDGTYTVSRATPRKLS